MNPRVLSDIALLIAVPVNRTEFGERVHNSDWLGKYRPPQASPEDLGIALDERWRNVYEPLVADPLEQVIELARSQGAEVRTRVGLADIAAVTRVKRIVILFAHWKGPEVVFDDLVPGANFDAFLSRAAESRTTLGTWVAVQLRKRASKGAANPLIDVLDDALDAKLPGVSRHVSSVLEHAVTRHARRREELEALFRDLLRPGNRLEMFDGLHSKEEVETCIAPDFDGILDLTTCTSTVLADYLAGRQLRRFRTVQFATVVEFVWAAKAVAGALHFTATGHFEYQEARLLAATELNRAIEEVRSGSHEKP